MFIDFIQVFSRGLFSTLPRSGSRPVFSRCSGRIRGKILGRILAFSRFTGDYVTGLGKIFGIATKYYRKRSCEVSKRNLNY
jgi:hypothetical protein